METVTLRGGDLPWQPVSPALVRARLIVLAMAMAIPIVATIVVALVLTPWVWIATGILIVATAVVGYVVTRQVGAISWIELPEEFVIRKGRVLRSLVAIPYGRLQFVDVQSGPVARAYGIASLQIHTASPQSSGTLPGLPIAQAEELRTRLAALGEAQRAGL